jgi:hypothetical protein
VPSQALWQPMRIDLWGQPSLEKSGWRVAVESDWKGSIANQEYIFFAARRMANQQVSGIRIAVTRPDPAAPYSRSHSGKPRITELKQGPLRLRIRGPLYELSRARTP